MDLRIGDIVRPDPEVNVGHWFGVFEIGLVTKISYTAPHNRATICVEWYGDVTRTWPDGSQGSWYAPRMLNLFCPGSKLQCR